MLGHHLCVEPLHALANGNSFDYNIHCQVYLLSVKKNKYSNVFTCCVFQCRLNLITNTKDFFMVLQLLLCKTLYIKIFLCLILKMRLRLLARLAAFFIVCL